MFEITETIRTDPIYPSGDFYGKQNQWHNM